RPHVRDAWALGEARRDNPILDLAQLHFGVFVSFKDVPIKLADAGGEGAEGWRDALGQRHIAELLQHELPRKGVVRAVFEGELDDREPEDGPRTPGDHMWHVVERTLDWNRDLLFDFFARVAWIERDDHDAGVRDVRVRLDLELLEGPEAQRDETGTEDDGQQSVV